MKSVEIVGYKRANLGKADAKALRESGSVPCVLYGGAQQVHFHVPAYLFRQLVYTPEAALVDVNIEGTVYKAILQDAQFHPVSETMLHADFLQVFEDKPVRMDIPLKTVGTAIGVTKGGKLKQTVRTLKVEALPANLPDFVTADVSNLDLGKALKVASINQENYKILNPSSLPVVSVEIPRALRGKQNQQG